ncbi:MAG: glutathione peroxidase [Cyclobacteriaceae bacterium]
MMKIITLIMAAMITNVSSIYDFKLNALDGTSIDFDKYKGKNLLIVNTASECGNTPQYADLQELHQKFGDRVTILGFPANNFGGQEPGSNQQIATFCEKNYGVTFQMFEKISVKGKDRHPLYSWLEEKTGKTPNWNFSKYLVKADGSVLFFSASVNPMDESILSQLK